MKRRTFLAGLTGLAAAGPGPDPGALAQGGSQGAADAYPSKPVTIIVPFAAGGTVDVLGRMVANHLQKKWNQPFVVENIGGAGSIIGVTKLARARPDGTTIGLASTSALAINPTLFGDKLTYNVGRDLAPITQISVVPNVLVVNPDKVKARSVADLITHLKANPGAVPYGSSGVGTSQHLAGELFQQLTGTRMNHVAYKGSSQMVPDLLGGQIDLAFDNVPLLLPHVRTGKLVALATATRERAPFDPTLPAVAETVPGFEATAWHGVLAPAGTPAPILDRLAAEIRAYMQEPETVQKMAELGATAASTAPDEFRGYIAAEGARWKQVIEAANIKPE